MTYRVVQWTTGNVGRRAVQAIVVNPNYELVGLYAYGEDKVGRDAGDLAGIEPTGVFATNNIEDLLALKPDVVSYNPIHLNLDHLCRILESGINVVSTSEFITGRWLGEEVRTRLHDAGVRGGASLYGSGVNPGFANVFALVSAAICDRVDSITVTESVDASGYASAETQIGVGFACDPDDPETAAKSKRGSAVFGDAVAMMADALGIELDSIDYSVEFARATEHIDLGFMTIPTGTVAGLTGSWFGTANGRTVISCNVMWRMGHAMDPDWPARHGYSVDIKGRPRVKSQFQILPPRDWNEPDYFGIGMIMTAMPAINAIPAVCAAAPGIVTAQDLPLITAHGFVSQ